MHFFHPVIVIFFTVASSLISTDVTYEELEELDATCNGLDTCKETRTFDSLAKYTCHCGSFCSKLRTCCVDSPYRDIKLPGRRPTCRPVNDEQGRHYYMVDYCSPALSQDEEMETLCKKELSEHSNLTPMIPVTSLDSNVTYKNYYCFRCNEATDNFIYWNVKVNVDSETDDDQTQDVKLVYDTVSKTWMAIVGKAGPFMPVTLNIKAPSAVESIRKECVPKAISVCSGNWRNKVVRKKCSKYTAFVHIPKNGENVRYRNPHCAICNFENLEKMGCAVGSGFRAGTTKRPFSFTCLLDINRKDGDKVCRIKQRCDNKSIWDPRFLVCKERVCGIPGQSVKNGICAFP